MTKTDLSTNGIDDLEIDSGTENLKNENAKEEGIILSPSKLVILTNLLNSAKDSIEKINALLGQNFESGDVARIAVSQIGENLDGGESDGEKGRIIEGVFDGENMIGPDGKQYSVPANYASKSKLVEGDILKLTITATGTFVYKQIGPIERKRVVGVLEQTPSGNFHVISDNKKWHVLTASVTYFKGNDTDEVVILVPKVGDSKWAAVENIVKQVK
jgi:hypothetical protein